MPGRLIVLEGGDGSGKTTLAAALAAALAAEGHQILATREPGGTAEGLVLRSLLLAENGTVWEPEAELLLVMAARVQHVRRVIAPALAAGAIVLCDRFVGSTLAYQGSGGGIAPAIILGLHHDLVGDLWPDATLLLDLDPAVALARSRARLAATADNEGRFEARDLSYHQRVRQGFLALAHARPGWTVLDASLPQAALLAAARAALQPLLSV